jgi:hypothetical protein
MRECQKKYRTIVLRMHQVFSTTIIAKIVLKLALNTNQSLSDFSQLCTCFDMRWNESLEQTGWRWCHIRDIIDKSSRWQYVRIMNLQLTLSRVKKKRGWIVTFGLWRIDANKVIKVIIISQITKIKCWPKMMKIKTMVYMGITFSGFILCHFQTKHLQNLFIYKYIVTKWHYLWGFFCFFLKQELPATTYSLESGYNTWLIYSLSLSGQHFMTRT